MSKEITKARILQEIQDKFKLRELEPEIFTFGEYVIPTYDIGLHVKHWETYEERFPISGNGLTHVFLVPWEEEWRIRRLDVLHETGANFDIDQVFLYGGTALHQYLFYDTVAPITSGTVKIFEFPQDIPMERQMLKYISINVSNFVAGGYVSVHLLREVMIVR